MYFYTRTMHELSVTESILNIVLRYAVANRVQKVEIINLKIGEMADLVDECIQNYFDYLSRGTIAEGAVLKIQRAPVVFQCVSCKNSYRVSIKDNENMQCPSCGGEKAALVSGREFYIESMEVT